MNALHKRNSPTALVKQAEIAEKRNDFAIIYRIRKELTRGRPFDGPARSVEKVVKNESKYADFRVLAIPNQKTSKYIASSLINPF